jgi:predicted Zn-dependent protease
VTTEEKDNLLALFYLATYYEAMGLKAKAHVNSAVIALKTGNIKNAEKLARAALAAPDLKKADKYKAEAILEEIQDGK